MVCGKLGCAVELIITQFKLNCWFSSSNSRNHSINKVKNLRYDRGLIYIFVFKQPRQDLVLCGFSFTRHSEKSFTQIYGTFKGVPLPRKGTNMHLRPEMHAVTKM